MLSPHSYYGGLEDGAVGKKNVRRFSLRYLAQRARAAMRDVDEIVRGQARDFIDLSFTSNQSISTLLALPDARLKGVRALALRSNHLTPESLARVAGCDLLRDGLVVLDVGNNPFLGVEGGQLLVAYAKAATRLRFVCMKNTNIPQRLQSVVEAVLLKRYLEQHAFEDEVVWLESIFNAVMMNDRAGWDVLLGCVRRHVFSSAEIPPLFVPLFKQRWERNLRRHRMRVGLTSRGVLEALQHAPPTLEEFVVGALPLTADRAAVLARVDKLGRSVGVDYGESSKLSAAWSAWEVLWKNESSVRIREFLGALGAGSSASCPGTWFSDVHTVAPQDVLMLALPTISNDPPAEGPAGLASPVSPASPGSPASCLQPDTGSAASPVAIAPTPPPHPNRANTPPRSAFEMKPLQITVTTN